MILTLLMVGIVHRSSMDHSVAGRLYVSKGKAYVVGQQDQQGQFVQICRANDTIQVSDHSAATVWLIGSGSRFQLSSPSTVRIENGSMVALKGSRPKRLARLATEVTAAFPEVTAQAAYQIRDEGKLRVTPCGGLLKAPETISWNAYPGAVSYDFSISEAGSSLSALEEKGMSKTGTALPPRCLKPGRLYRLSLAANLPHGGCAMTFRSLRLLTESESAALAKAEQALDAQCPGSPDAELAKADLYEQYGLYGDSLKCLTELARTSPSDGLAQEISKMRRLADGRS